MSEQSDTPRTDATQYQWTRTLDLARDLERELATATRERDEAQAELETERLRLAACGVVAMANTPESAARVRDILPKHFSASLHSVMGAVDREMEFRAEAERLRAELFTALRGDGLEHLYDGDCPASNALHARDPRCPACNRLDELTAAEAKP